ncbi:MAG: hypothetical protein WBZ11_22740 [Candidatus Sulfotelmatobacter sp.]
MKSLNSVKVFVVGTLSIGLFSSTALIPATVAAGEYELPRVYDASMPRDQQITLAESAAPAEVSGKATVYVLGPKGYEKAREGTNGFSCFVGRHFVKPAETTPAETTPAETTIEPQCFDAEGSRTLLLVYMHGEELRTNGKSEAEIKADIANGYKEGRYQHPSKPGFLYMMSSQNRLRAIPEHGTGIFPPHLMFYAPNMTTKDIGFDAQPELDKLDYLGMTHPGAGDNLIVVIPVASKSPADAAGR